MVLDKSGHFGRTLRLEVHRPVDVHVAVQSGQELLLSLSSRRGCERGSEVFVVQSPTLDSKVSLFFFFFFARLVRERSHDEQKKEI